MVEGLVKILIFQKNNWFFSEKNLRFKKLKLLSNIFFWIITWQIYLRRSCENFKSTSSAVSKTSTLKIVFRENFWDPNTLGWKFFQIYPLLYAGSTTNKWRIRYTYILKFTYTILCSIFWIGDWLRFFNKNI